MFEVVRPQSRGTRRLRWPSGGAESGVASDSPFVSIQYACTVIDQDELVAAR